MIAIDPKATHDAIKGVPSEACVGLDLADGTRLVVVAHKLRAMCAVARRRATSGVLSIERCTDAPGGLALVARWGEKGRLRYWPGPDAKRCGHCPVLWADFLLTFNERLD